MPILKKMPYSKEKTVEDIFVKVVDLQHPNLLSEEFFY